MFLKFKNFHFRILKSMVKKIVEGWWRRVKGGIRGRIRKRTIRLCPTQPRINPASLPHSFRALPQLHASGTHSFSLSLLILWLASPGTLPSQTAPHSVFLNWLNYPYIMYDYSVVWPKCPFLYEKQPFFVSRIFGHILSVLLPVDAPLHSAQ